MPAGRRSLLVYDLPDLTDNPPFSGTEDADYLSGGDAGPNPCTYGTPECYTPGPSATNTLYGLGGDDTLRGGDSGYGNYGPSVIAGPVQNTLHGGPGADKLFGGSDGAGWGGYVSNTLFGAPTRSNPNPHQPALERAPSPPCPSTDYNEIPCWLLCPARTGDDGDDILYEGQASASFSVQVNRLTGG